MPRKKLRLLYPGLSEPVARHVVRQLRALDWQQLQQIAAQCCQDCPGKTEAEGPPCDFCPLRPITLELGITAARARSAQHDDAYLESLPTKEDADQ